MGTTVITLSTIAGFLFGILFLFLLYIIGGISENLKRVIEKMEELESKLSAKS